MHAMLQSKLVKLCFPWKMFGSHFGHSGGYTEFMYYLVGALSHGSRNCVRFANAWYRKSDSLITSQSDGLKRRYTVIDTQVFGCPAPVALRKLGVFQLDDKTNGDMSDPESDYGILDTERTRYVSFNEKVSVWYTNCGFS